MRKVLVLSGGSLFGCIQIGALKHFCKLDVFSEIKHICGTSAGSLSAFFIILGFSPEDIEYLLLNIEFEQYFQMDPTLLLSDYGCNYGDKLYRLLRFILKQKLHVNDITFKELQEKTGYHFTVTATCINNEKSDWIFSPDTFPDFSVLLAIRMSIAMPGIFTPIIWEGKYMIDGAFCGNYRSNLFPDDQVYGIRCENKNKDYSIDDPISYIGSIYNVSLTYLYNTDVITPHTLSIYPETMATTDLIPTKETIQSYIDMGYDAASKFDWNKEIDIDTIDKIVNSMKDKTPDMIDILICKLRKIKNNS
jgi:hypothetical protein